MQLPKQLYIKHNLIKCYSVSIEKDIITLSWGIKPNKMGPCFR